MLRPRIAGLFAAAAAACLVFGPTGASAGEPPPWVTPAVDAPRVQHRTFESAAAKAKVSYFVYTPAEYDAEPERRFPVLYWLHGTGGGLAGVKPLTAYFDGAIREGRTPPVIVVLPNGLRESLWCDSHDGTVPVETVVVKELIPHVDATFRTVATREGRLLEGFSMGGYGAGRLGFRYPELFATVSMLAGGPLQEVFRVDETPRADPAEARRILQNVFGGEQASFRERGPWGLAEKNAAALRAATRLRVVIGGRDNTLGNNRAFAAHLAALRIPHTFTVLPGVAHDPMGVLEALGESNFLFYRTAFGSRPVADVALPVASPEVRVIGSVPQADRGADVADFANGFAEAKLGARNGAVALRLGREPVYVLDGDVSPAATVPAAESPFGFHPALVPERGGPFAAAQEIGVRWHRGTYAYWVQVQRTEEDIAFGLYDWSGTDREWGSVPGSMATFANVGLPERRVRSDGRLTWTLAFPEDDYTRFLKAAVERYDGDGVKDMPGLRVPVRHWQVENEPDIASDDWEGYARLQEISYGAIKEACPGAVVAMGGQTGRGIEAFDAFYEPALAKLGGRFVDVFDIHWYGDARLDWRRVAPVVEHVRRRLDALGYAKTEIWITEMGSYSGKPGDEGGARRGPPSPAQTEREQARDVVKRHVFPFALGVRKVFWAFGLAEAFKHDDGYFDHTGFIYDGQFDDDPGRGVRKLAYHTYRRMTELLDGADWPRAKLLSLGADVTAVQVPRGKGTVTVAWYDPAYTLADVLPATALSRLRARIAGLASTPTTRDTAAARLRAFRELIAETLEAGGPAAVEPWAPRAALQAVERKILEGADDAGEALDAVIREAAGALR